MLSLALEIFDDTKNMRPFFEHQNIRPRLIGLIIFEIDGVAKRLGDSRRVKTLMTPAAAATAAAAAATLLTAFARARARVPRAVARNYNRRHSHTSH